MTLRANVCETGRSPLAVRIEAGGNVLIADEPKSAGGAGLGPSPYELLLAALGACTAMTVRWYARQKQWPLEHVEVDVTYEKKRGGEARQPSDVITKVVFLHGNMLTLEERSRLLEVAKRCPVQQTLEHKLSIETVDGGPELQSNRPTEGRAAAALNNAATD